MFAVFCMLLAVAQWLQMPSGSHCAKCVDSLRSLIQLILLDPPRGHALVVRTENVRVSVQVSLLGHSAGGQMCAMALLHRAKALSKRTKLARRSNGHQQELAPAQDRMPARFIGSLSSHSSQMACPWEP